jgi:hypothetical protein
MLVRVTARVGVSSG